MKFILLGLLTLFFATVLDRVCRDASAPLPVSSELEDFEDGPSDFWTFMGWIASVLYLLAAILFLTGIISSVWS